MEQMVEQPGAYGLRLAGAPLGPVVLQRAPQVWPQIQVTTSPELPLLQGPRLDAEAAVIELRDGERTLVVDRATSAACFHGPPLDPDVLAHPYLGPVASVFSRWLGREVFHGGAFLTSRGQAVAVLGGRTAGKSTLMAGLAARGATVIADDLVVIERGRIFAGPRTVDLRAEPVPALRGDLTVSRARGWSRWRLALPPAAPSYPLGGWAFLHGAAEPTGGAVVITQSGLTVTPVPATDRLRRLARARGLPTLASDPRDLLELTALPSWDVIRPLRWDMLEPTVDALLSLRTDMYTTM